MYSLSVVFCPVKNIIMLWVVTICQWRTSILYLCSALTCRAIVQGWLFIVCLSRCGIPVVVAYSKIPTTSTSKCLELGESTIAKYFILTKVCRNWGTLNLHVLFRKGFLYHWATVENNCSLIQWIEHYISKNPRVLYIDKPGKFLF